MSRDRSGVSGKMVNSWRSSIRLSRLCGTTAHTSAKRTCAYSAKMESVSTAICGWTPAWRNAASTICRHRLPADVERALNLTHHASLDSLAQVCDVVTLNCPLHPETEHMIDDDTLRHFKRGACLINTARGKLCDRDAIVRALESGRLAGYVGDVRFPQPAPNGHPWRMMPHRMTPHMSGTSL